MRLEIEIQDGDKIARASCWGVGKADDEATLKRLRKKGESVALEAANPAYETRIFGPDRVRVQGRLVGLLRKY